MLRYGDVPLFWVLFWGLLPDFWVPFRAIPGFLGILFGYFRIFGYHFLVKFDFFWNNPDFRGIDFDISINDILECCLQGSCFYDSTVLTLFYYVCAKSSMLSITAISLSSYICGAF